MDEEAPDGPGDRDENRDQVETIGHGLGQTERVHGHEPAKADEDHIDGMGARIDEPVHLLRAVMNGVKTPEEGAFVGSAVAPVGSDFTNNQRGGDPENERQFGNPLIKSSSNQVMQGGCEKSQRQD